MFTRLTKAHLRSLLVLDQWRKKASLHSTRNVFVELGDDFRYGFSGEAELMYSNYKVST